MPYNWTVNSDGGIQITVVIPSASCFITHSRFRQLTRRRSEFRQLVPDNSNNTRRRFDQRDRGEYS